MEAWVECPHFCQIDKVVFKRVGLLVCGFALVPYRFVWGGGWIPEVACTRGWGEFSRGPRSGIYQGWWEHGEAVLVCLVCGPLIAAVLISILVTVCSVIIIIIIMFFSIAGYWTGILHTVWAGLYWSPSVVVNNYYLHSVCKHVSHIGGKNCWCVKLKIPSCESGLQTIEKEFVCALLIHQRD